MKKKTDINLPALATIYKALSDETRLKILFLLAKKPLCVCEIMGALNITQTKTSRHLIYLKNAGLLESSKEDRWMVYRIRRDLPREIGTLIKETISLIENTGELSENQKGLENILKNESIYRQTYGVGGKDDLDSPSQKPAPFE